MKKAFEYFWRGSVLHEYEETLGSIRKCGQLQCDGHVGFVEIRNIREIPNTTEGGQKYPRYYPFLQITVTSLIFNQFLQILARFVY